MQNIQHVDVMFLLHYYVLIFVYFRYFPPFHRRKDAMTFQLLPTHHQLSMCLVVELRGDVQALGLGELVARYFACAAIRLNDGSRCQLKIAPTYFLPRRFHISDGLHYVFVLFTSQLGNNAVDSEYFLII